MPPFPRLRTPTYTNTGSVARDHLASERTFLAWLRTGLGFIALGIAIERFAQLDLQELVAALKPPPPPVSPSAATAPEAAERRVSSGVLVGALLGTGSGSIVYGTARYFATMRVLEQGLFRPSYWGAAGLGVGVAGIAGGVYWNAVRERVRARREES
ncbi:hypothetical protein FH972_021515 [Carpinus fangiana]|uniref:DUF202 domain-containing protein n=1 Tax=Carpinus fangiana TaxID=176857 RepID=A0A5N6KPW9_9ROSI|nr:hypothetical protein FH972_021515 [Carpinus fangiana]